MATGIEAAGDGLKTVLTTNLTSIKRIYAPKELPDSIAEYPTALILPGETLYDTGFGAHYDTTLRLILIFGNVDRPVVWNTMLDYIEETGTYSVVAAVKTDRTLNASVNDCKVVRNLGFSSFTYAGILYPSTEFEIKIWL